MNEQTTLYGIALIPFAVLIALAFYEWVFADTIVERLIHEIRSWKDSLYKQEDRLHLKIISTLKDYGTFKPKKGKA